MKTSRYIRSYLLMIFVMLTVLCCTASVCMAAATLYRPTNITAISNDYINAGVDGRDFTVNWTPSVSSVTSQQIYILPAGTTVSDLATLTPVASFSNNTAKTWTGTQTLTTDSVGNRLKAGTYDVYVAAIFLFNKAVGIAQITVGFPTGLIAVDNDIDNLGVDGRDFTVSWTTSASSPVTAQKILILPDAAAVPDDLTTLTPVATFADNTTCTWTGDASNTLDSANPRAALGKGTYKVFVLAQNAYGWSATYQTIDVRDDLYKYEILDNEAKTIKLLNYNSYDSLVDIPGTLYGFTVTEIGSSFLPANCAVTGITIPAQVKNINEAAFDYCDTLTYITVDNGNEVYTSINGLLCNKAGTTILKCPRGLTGYLTIPSSVTDIEDRAFYDCELTGITFQSGINIVGYQAFKNCINLSSVNFEKGVSILNYYAFSSCSSLTSIVLPGVIEIGNGAFWGCSALTCVSIDSTSLTAIGNFVFQNCTGLTNINIPDSVTSIGEIAFNNCQSLTAINLPAYVISIGPKAFYGCYDLTSITIPASTTSIGEEAFGYCPNLKAITVDEANEIYASIGGVLYNKLGTELIRCPEGLTGKFIIPSTVTTIRALAFNYCSGLTSVTIPYGVTSIGDFAFRDCTGLTGGIIIPSSVTEFGAGTFERCSRLTYIRFNSKDTIIVELYYGHTIPSETLIIGFKGSTAYFYALNHAIRFQEVYVVIDALVSDKASPQTVNTPITWTCYAIGTENPTYDFFERSGLDNWEPIPSSGNVCVWTPTLAGTYDIKVRAHNNDASYDEKQVNFTVTLPVIDECFIATAAFGSKFTWPVALLRNFRDQYLLPNTLGTAFVNFYYQHSPPIAAMIASSPPLKTLVRVILAPVIAMVYVLYHPLLMGTLLVLIIMFFAYRSRLRRKSIRAQ